ncbi:unnamed protein product [Prunus armeniaca]|uniref:Uncharacterized protein n=1 Tax=Prunus armeniaca TaxID=36596 RepID=A0A6J5UQ42_PRUAR|nr:unnamed protein product [Prunus armeniaca]
MRAYDGRFLDPPTNQVSETLSASLFSGREGVVFARNVAISSLCALLVPAVLHLAAICTYYSAFPFPACGLLPSCVRLYTFKVFKDTAIDETAIS